MRIPKAQKDKAYQGKSRLKCFFDTYLSRLNDQATLIGSCKTSKKISDALNKMEDCFFNQ